MSTIFKLRLAVLCLVSTSFWLLIALTATPAQKLPMVILEQPANAPPSVLQASADVLQMDSSGVVTGGEDSSGLGSDEPLTLALQTTGVTSAEGHPSPGSIEFGELGSGTGPEKSKRRSKTRDGTDASDDLSGVSMNDATVASSNDDPTQIVSDDDSLGNLRSSNGPSTTDDSYGQRQGDEILQVTAKIVSGSYSLVFNWQQGCAWDDLAAMWDCTDNWEACPEMAQDTSATVALGNAIDHLSTLKYGFSTIPAASAFAGVAMVQLVGGSLLSRARGAMLPQLLDNSCLQLVTIVLTAVLAVVGWCAGIAGVVVLGGTEVSVSDYTTPPRSKLGGAWYMLLFICLLLCAAVIISWTVHVRQTREALFLQMSQIPKFRGTCPADCYVQNAEKARDGCLSTIREHEEGIDLDSATDEDADEKNYPTFASSAPQGCV